MTTTPFRSPTTINQVQIHDDITGYDSIAWNNLPAIAGNDSYAETSQTLYTISGFWQERFLSSTNQIWLTGFNFPDTGGTVLGIEFQLHILRSARVEDYLIQLTKDGSTLVGNNYASTVNPVQSDTYTAEITIPQNPVGDYNIYGGPADLWGTTWTSAEIANPNFGIAISFHSNQIYPHRDLAYVNQVALRITYA